MFVSVLVQQQVSCTVSNAIDVVLLGFLRHFRHVLVYSIHDHSLVVFGLLDRVRPTSMRTPGRSPFQPKGASTPWLSSSQRAHPLPANTCSVPEITDGGARAWWPQRWFTFPLRRPDCTLSRLHSREYDRPATQPIATPEAGCPGPHPRSSQSSLRPRVCFHTREPTVLSRVSCRPSHLNIDRFHQFCLLPGRIPG